MRMMKKVLGTVTVLALSVSLLAGCGSTAASPVSSAASTAAESTTSSVVPETTFAAADENVAAAAQLLNDLTGSYQELWPVILADEYKQTWLDDCTALHKLKCLAFSYNVLRIFCHTDRPGILFLPLFS